jgi:hypothetical protein
MTGSATLGNALNDHTTALVPIEAWAYQSPDLRRQGRQIDIGLLAEALIYYDRVLVVPESQATYAKVFEPWQQPPQPTEQPTTPQPSLHSPFVEFVDWFAARDDLGSLIALLKAGELAIYHYAFRSVPFEKDGSFNVINMQAADEGTGPTFMRKLFADRGLERVVTKARQREQLYRALEKAVIERHANELDGPSTMPGWTFTARTLPPPLFKRSLTTADSYSARAFPTRSWQRFLARARPAPR